MLRLFVLVLWAILMPLSALAADFYFAVDGDDLATCTRDEPCQSLVKAGQLINQANPGDTFHFQGGDTFDGGHDICISAQNIDGKRDRPITLTSYGKGRAIFVNCKPLAFEGRAVIGGWWSIWRSVTRTMAYAVSAAKIGWCNTTSGATWATFAQALIPFQETTSPAPPPRGYASVIMLATKPGSTAMARGFIFIQVSWKMWSWSTTSSST